jgi:hypothetical protein
VRKILWMVQRIFPALIKCVRKRGDFSETVDCNARRHSRAIVALKISVYL